MLQVQKQAMPNYNYTVPGLLAEARIRRATLPDCDEHTDHVVELQLVVAALNTLPNNTYRRANWQRDLVDFFNHERNLQCLTRQQNLAKRNVVWTWINGDRAQIMDDEMEWIEEIRERWNEIAPALHNFVRFSNALNHILEV